MNAAQFLSALHRATVFLHGALALALFILIAGRGSRAHMLLAVVAVLPLLAALPGLWRRRAYTAGWACMVVSFYCALLLAEAYMLPSIKGALLVLAVVAALDFVALMLYAKAQKAVDRQLASQAQSGVHKGHGQPSLGGE